MYSKYVTNTLINFCCQLAWPFTTNEMIMGQIFCSRGRPVEQFYWTSSRFQGTSNRNSTGRPVEIFIAFLNEISNSKTFETNLQNSSGRPVESYWTSSRIQRTSYRSFTGRPLEQKIWANAAGAGTTATTQSTIHARRATVADARALRVTPTLHEGLGRVVVAVLLQRNLREARIVCGYRVEQNLFLRSYAQNFVELHVPPAVGSGS